MKKDLRIVYLGTPEFAVPSLAILVENGWNVVGVITAPDKPQGRGQKLQYSPIKEYALSKNLKILQPCSLKSPAFLEELKTLSADLQIVVAFRMLPEAVWNMPPMGTFNLHASLLPAYRGAAPINWAIINGESKTGISTFFLKHEIDTGNILFQEDEAISETDTAGDLYNRLMHKGATLVLKTVEAISEDKYTEIPQVQLSECSHAPKIFKETCKIDCNQPAIKVYNFIRGLSPYPTAWTIFKDKQLKVFGSAISDLKQSGSIGEFVSDGKSYLSIKCSDGWLDLKDIQWEGRKRMHVDEFLRGISL
jgi:methionyl-tRNA formyltransferase